MLKATLFLMNYCFFSPLLLCKISHHRRNCSKFEKLIDYASVLHLRPGKNRINTSKVCNQMRVVNV